MRAVVCSLFLAGAAFGAVSFDTDIRPVLTKECLGCHNANRALGGIRLQSREAALKSNALVPGKPEASLLFLSIERKAGQTNAMPPGQPLPAGQREAIKEWIAE